jgi:RNA 2',3'-cyclic 3'-phosphodiesterase
MRLFIAMPIPEPVKAELLKLQGELRAAGPREGVRWAKAEQFHLTLKFLGEVEAGRLEALLAATRLACEGRAAVVLRAAQAGFFPNERRPRVLWTGLHCPTDGLQVLQRAVEAATSEFAEKQENRPFSAHLTLARFKDLSPAETRPLAARVAGMSGRVLGEWTADKVEVMRSELHPEGSQHTCLEAISLVDTLVT